MKKRILALGIAVIGTIGFNISMEKTKGGNLLNFKEVEAIASSERGCIERPGDNDGDCTGDGKFFFCEDSFWFHDCVKGEYPN